MTVSADHSFVAVSCPTSSFCLAVNDASDAFTYDGTSWSGAKAIPTDSASSSNGDLVGVSCASSSFCVAVGANDDNGTTYGSIYNGTAWSAPTTIDADDYPALDASAVSCPSSSFCLVGDQSGNVVLFNGHSWSAPSAITTGHTIDSVSCSSSSFCVATSPAPSPDNSIQARIYNGSTWSTPTDVAANTAVGTAVSCASSSFCVAVGEGASGSAAAVFDGTSWSAPTTFDSNYYLDNAVSCASSSLCAVVGNDGDAVTYSDGSWSSPTVIDPSGDDFLPSVSCGSGSLCVAVGDDGNAIAYGTAASGGSTAPTGATTVLKGPLGPLKATKITTTAITLSWRAPTSGPRPWVYGVFYDAGRRNGKLIGITSRKTTFVVRGLRPRTRYRFDVVDSDVNGNPGGDLVGPWMTTK